MDETTLRSRLPAAALIAAGLAVSAYLLLRTLALLQGTPGVIDFCSGVFGSGCDETLRSERWWVLGVPAAGWGVTYFGMLAGLLAMGWTLSDLFEREAAIAATLLSFAGLLVGIPLTGMMFMGLAPLCPLCLIVHGVNLLLVAALFRHSRASPIVLGARIWSALRFVVGAGPRSSRDAAWKGVGFVTCALIGLAIYQWILVEVAEHRAGANHPATLIAAYEAEPVQDAEAPGGARLGPGTAAAKLVVFSSFQCPGCQALIPLLHRVAEHFGDEVAITFRHFPLGTRCNAHALRDRHPRACDAAWAAAAAHVQGRFWEFHDALFEGDLEPDEQDILAAAARAGLDLDRFAADRMDESVRALVAADTALATQLGVDGTPALFLNGRRVRRISSAALVVLVQHVLGSGSL